MSLDQAKETLAEVLASALNNHDSIVREVTENPESWGQEELQSKAEEYISEGDYQIAIILLALAESEGDW